MDVEHRPTRDREVAALTEAMAELSVPCATVVTGSEDAALAEGIDAAPAWRWLLTPEPVRPAR